MKRKPINFFNFATRLLVTLTFGKEANCDVYEADTNILFSSNHVESCTLHLHQIQFLCPFEGAAMNFRCSENGNGKSRESCSSIPMPEVPHFYGVPVCAHSNP